MLASFYPQGPLRSSISASDSRGALRRRLVHVAQANWAVPDGTEGSRPSGASANSTVASDWKAVQTSSFCDNTNAGAVALQGTI